MLTIAGRFSLVLADLINQAIDVRKEHLASFISGIEEVRKLQGEIIGLRLCLELMEDADRKVRGVEGEK